MTAQLLASELTNLIQESKRKHNDLRQAAEKSLEELKSLKSPPPSEGQIGAELAQKANFVNPFIIACGTKNAKFTGIAIVCLQRLIVAKALPQSKLSQVLEALQQGTSAGLDVQLKILQALPSLLSNYASEINGNLLVTALNICFILQSSKNAIVNNTSAATLQQLVVSIYDKVVLEDKSETDAAIAGEAAGPDGPIPLKAAALDAHRVFKDICLLTENQRPEYLKLTGLPQTFGLELIESVLTNHSSIFNTHPEQADILRVLVMPFVISGLRGKPNFSVSVRLVRILYTILRKHLSVLPSECGDALDIMTHLLDQDTALWKRSLCMEVFRGIFGEPALLRRIYTLFDHQEGEKDILKTLTATFVKVSTEKPAVIGLGHQSTIPVANPYGSGTSSADQAMVEASVTGIITSSVGDGHSTGISSQWSATRVPCIDQLDKTEPPAIPESYIYSLTLACITSLSEGLAKFILPLTVPGDRGRKRSVKQEQGFDSPALPAEDGAEATADRAFLDRTASFKKNPVPINPLTLQNHPLAAEVSMCAAFIDECWPAILATCSTFLTAALDSEYYHGLVRAFQKFAHVAGLLQLTTPRDAFLTTLGKAAVPSNILTACLNAGTQRPGTAASSDSGSLFGNARGLLNVESGAASGEKPKPLTSDMNQLALNTRNLLCLRALLNLGIALGPTLSSSWRIILETLQQADFVLFTTGKTAGRTPTAVKNSDQQAEQEAQVLLANFSTEIKAVETAASRLFDSTVDFPNAAFVGVVEAICNLVEKRVEPVLDVAIGDMPQTPLSGGILRTPLPHKRVMSISGFMSTAPNQEDQFALAKLGDLASINLERLLAHPPEESGWIPLTSELMAMLGHGANTAPVRARAAETLVRFILEAAAAVASQPEEGRGEIQMRLLEVLRNAMRPLEAEDREVSVAVHGTDVDMHKILLDGLKSMLDGCGESLVSGWHLTFDMMGTIFMTKRFGRDEKRASGREHEVLMTRSVRLIRPSFASLQLICSDFLSALPNSCFLHLINTLYKFCSQDDDLNVALTTVTFFWAISDFLSGKRRPTSIGDYMKLNSSDETLVRLASDASHASSGAALWMLLLLRLTSVATDHRLELRNSAIQTLMRIISAYGDSLDPEAWSVCIQSVIFRLLASIEQELEMVTGTSDQDKNKNDWKETAMVVVQGVSELFGSYLNVLTAHDSFTSMWKELLAHFAAMLDFHLLDINAAVFGAVRDILRRGADAEKPSWSKDAVDLGWELWSRSVPVPPEVGHQKSPDNQKCLLVWVETLLELYRLNERDLSVERVQRKLTLLREAMQHATPGTYASDIEHVTPLQGKILDVFRAVRTDICGVPSAMITQVAEFVSLPFEPKETKETKETGQAVEKRTYVAMSKESMALLKCLVIQNSRDAHVYESGAFATALSALTKPIVLKYQFAMVTKSTQPWKEAVQAALAILEATLPHMGSLRLPRMTVQDIWRLIVLIANGIVSADCDAAPVSTNILEDEEFDMTAFQKLRALIVPALGADVIPDKTRQAYSEGLFRVSIVHSPAPSETSMMHGSSSSGDATSLGALYRPRNGRTIDPPPTKRSRMSGVCLDELFSLVAAHDPTTAADPVMQVQPPSPHDQDTVAHEAANETAHDLHIRLARTAAPHLMLRCALTLRSYIADHPLRGRMPQPLSQRRELTRVLARLTALRSEPAAIPDTPNVDSEGCKHLLRLYPLLVAAVQVAGTAGDDKVLALVRESLEVVGGELGAY